MSAARQELRISEALAREIANVQANLVNDRCLPPLLELHALGFDVSEALVQSFKRGFHEISKALLDAQVRVTYEAEYQAAKRGSQAFSLLCAYHKPSAGALASAVSRKDLRQIELIFELGARCRPSSYYSVPVQLSNDDPEIHRELLHLMVRNTDDRDLTIDVLRTIVQDGKPADLVDALNRSPVDANTRATLLLDAICAGADGNVVALRAEGHRVNAKLVYQFATEALHKTIMTSTTDVMTRLLEFYRADNQDPLQPEAAEASLRRLISGAWREMIRPVTTSDAACADRTRRGLIALSACVNRSDRYTLTAYINRWIDGYNQSVTPGVSRQARDKLVRECETCFWAVDSRDSTLEDSQCPAP